MRRQSALSRKVAAVGVSATRQGAHPHATTYDLAVEALTGALEDAGLAKTDLDGLLGAKLYDTVTDPVELARICGLDPRVTGYLDYSTGGFTTQYAAMLIATGVCEVVACVFGRVLPNPMRGLSGATMYDPVHGLVNAAAVAAMGWTRHMALYGTTERALADVAVTFRDNARLNDNAAYTDPLTVEQYLAEPYLIWPFRDLDVAKVTDGACAIVFTTPERAKDLRHKPVWMEAVGRQQATRVLDHPEHFLLHGMRSVAEQVYGEAGVGPQDVDVLGISDASTAAVLQTLEEYGFCERGESEEFVRAGNIALGGRFPVNTDGGQLSGGYLVGWLHQVELVRQLRGEAGARQVPGARVGQYFTTGRYRQDFLSTIYTVD